MKHLHTLGIALITTGLSLTGCNKKEPAQQVKSNGLPKAATTQTTAPVAIVDIDSLASQYEYCKEGLAALDAKQAKFRQQLNNKGQTLQNGMVEFQKKLQSGGYTSQQQAEQAQAKLQKQQQALQNLQMKIEEEMAEATQTYQDQLRKNLHDFLKEFNKDGRYKVILSKSGDNVLYADPTVDITSEVVAGLNKNYTKK
ncbi:lipoprotein [gut metagenome]|uniref:Lipoprotein n=1 Tax=gut metagenome TaxID=749906 RepID=J9GFW1_9ZZZZ